MVLELVAANADVQNRPFGISFHRGRREAFSLVSRIEKKRKVQALRQWWQTEQVPRVDPQIQQAYRGHVDVS